MTAALTSTIARELLLKSPKHAWTASRELNPNYVEAQSEEFDLGRAVHQWLLEQKTDRFVVVDAPDWKKKTAQETRAEARAAHKFPMLAHQYAQMFECMKAAQLQIALFDDQPEPRPLMFGRPEVSLEWTERGVTCRARLDWLHDTHRYVDDLKTTSGSAHPDVWGRRNLWDKGYDVQAAFYLRGVRAVHGKQADFRFVVLELDPPYGMSVIGLEPEALALADQKVDRALDLWRECLENNIWPMYPHRVAYVEMPPWERMRSESAMTPNTNWLPTLGVVDDGRPIDEQLFGDRP